jgi:hypothetical protein
MRHATTNFELRSRYERPRQRPARAYCRRQPLAKAAIAARVSPSYQCAARLVSLLWPLARIKKLASRRCTIDFCSDESRVEPTADGKAA